MHNRFSAYNLKFAFLSQFFTFVVILQQNEFCRLGAAIKYSYDKNLTNTLPP